MDRIQQYSETFAQSYSTGEKKKTALKVCSQSSDTEVTSQARERPGIKDY